MPTQNDPRQKNDLSFSSFDDAPTNRTGRGQDESDWEIGKEYIDDREDNDYGKENDDWEDEYDRVNPERYD